MIKKPKITIKQKTAFSEVVKGSTIQGAMRKAGYAQSTSKRTNKLTRTPGWQYLMNKYLPDKDLARVHQEGLKAVKKEHKIVDRDDDGKPIYDFIDVEDFATRHKYLDSAYKIKRYYPSENSQPPGDLKILILSFGNNPPSQLATEDIIKSLSMPDNKV